MQRWSLDLLTILNVCRKSDGHDFSYSGQGRLFVANHVSWLDVFVMNAAAPARFIAKSEVGAWPLFGWLSRRTGTLFVRRDTRRDAMRVNRLIAAMLQEGEWVALFPEGTSTDGTRHVHFHSSLLQGAIDAGAAIHTMAIRYHDANGNRLDDAAFIGDMTFLQSLQKILCSPALHVTLAGLPALNSSGTNRRLLAQAAQVAVNAALDNLSAAARLLPEDNAAAVGTFHQSLTCSSSCGNNPLLNSFPDYLGDDDAEPDPAATPAA
jgi:1-acyl-sn-glycerol-3-phosphate acyltransferase